jgi:uncharacterized protein (TIGR03083 family)
VGSGAGRTEGRFAAVNHEDYCDALEADAGRLVELVTAAELTAPVPTCPGWTVADVVGHVGTLYRWSAAHVATAARARIAPDTLDLGVPAEGPTPTWLADGIGPMLTTFRSGDPDAAAWGWGGDRHARFWPRRMLFETVVHRTDAALALGVEPAVEADVASDGIDELLSNLPHAAYFAPGIAELRGDDERLALRPTDADTAWRIRLVPAGYAWDWSTGHADVTVEGRAADLLALLYRRRDPSDEDRFEREGDLALLDRFLSHAQL